MHVGRAGLFGGIGVRGVEALRVKGAEQIEAIIGPAICGQCYEVGEAMAEDSEKVMPGSSCVTRWGPPGSISREPLPSNCGATGSKCVTNGFVLWKMTGTSHIADKRDKRAGLRVWSCP